MNTAKVSALLNEMDDRDICVLFPLLKDRLARLGMWKSMHAVDKAQDVVGWETAERMQLRTASQNKA